VETSDRLPEPAPICKRLQFPNEDPANPVTVQTASLSDGSQCSRLKGAYANCGKRSYAVGLGPLIVTFTASSKKASARPQRHCLDSCGNAALIPLWLKSK
jgi:hypothetical protein